MSQSSFEELHLIEPLKRALVELGYEKPTPIQQMAIPVILEGQDLLGIAQTGTGKTAAFCLPILQLLHDKRAQRLASSPRVLILTPTRELAVQIHKSLTEYGKHLQQRYAVVFGGVSQEPQVRDLKAGVDVLVATPGRLLDLVEQKLLRLNRVEFFVLDEADRMLDLGFLPEVQKVLPLLPEHRHNLFFSATMPQEIEALAAEILTTPKTIEVTPPATTVESVRQLVMFVEKKNKADLLLHLLKDPALKKALVFVQMKHVANRVAQKLLKNKIPTAVIHGDKSQGARQEALEIFTKGQMRVMIATDIASRGIDIEGITHVINYDLSHVAENYVHRIGRTARAGAQGTAISLVMGDERSYLYNIERTTRQQIEVVSDQPFHSEEAATAKIMSVGKAKAKIEAQSQSSSPSTGRGGGGGGGRKRPPGRGKTGKRKFTR